jgi:hypothetical protein
MLALIERQHSCVPLKPGRHERRTFTPAVVASVSREGAVLAVKLANGKTVKHRDWTWVAVDSRGKANAVIVVKKLTADGQPIEYDTLEAAVTAMKAAAGIRR